MVHFPAFTIKFNHTRPHESHGYIYIFIHTMLYDPSIRFPSDSIQPLLFKRPPRFPISQWPTSRALVVTENNWRLQPFKACVCECFLVVVFVHIYIYTYMWGSYPKVSKLMITVILCHIKCLKFIRMFFTDEIVDCVLFLDPGKGWYSFYEVDGLSSKVLCTMLNISCLTLKYVQFVHVNIYIIPNMVGNQSKINTSNLFIPPGQ